MESATAVCEQIISSFTASMGFVHLESLDSHIDSVRGNHFQVCPSTPTYIHPAFSHFLLMNPAIPLYAQKMLSTASVRLDLFILLIFFAGLGFSL